MSGMLSLQKLYTQLTNYLLTSKVITLSTYCSMSKENENKNDNWHIRIIHQIVDNDKLKYKKEKEKTNK